MLNQNVLVHVTSDKESIEKLADELIEENLEAFQALAK